MSIRAVAELAGVSAATVSRVLNNSGYVSDATRRRVEQAAMELGYRPNPHARRLRGVGGRLIALLFNQVAHPFSSDVTLAIDEISERHGYFVIAGNTHQDNTRFERYLETFVANGVDGLIVVPPTVSPEVEEALRAVPVPYCLIDQQIPSLNADQIVTDNVSGAYAVTRQLLANGNRRIAFIGGNPKNQKARDRLKGYENALREYGIAHEASLVRMREFDQRSGFELTTEVLAGELPDALFAANMDIQVGMLRALRAAGLHAPADVALGAIDELPYAAEYSPFEVVAAQQTRTIGVIAAQLLIDKLEGRRDPSDHQVVVLQPQLIRRGRPRADTGEAVDEPGMITTERCNQERISSLNG